MPKPLASLFMMMSLAAAAVPASASAAQPAEGYRSADGRVGCALYVGYDSHGNAVRCGRRGSARGYLLASTGSARKVAWTWPSKALGSLFFKAPVNQTLYLTGGTAKLEGDAGTLRCRFTKASVTCRNGGGHGLKITRASARAFKD